MGLRRNNVLKRIRAACIYRNEVDTKSGFIYYLPVIPKIYLRRKKKLFRKSKKIAVILENEISIKSERQKTGIIYTIRTDEALFST